MNIIKETLSERPCQLSDIRIDVIAKMPVDDEGDILLSTEASFETLDDTPPYWCNHCEQTFLDWHAAEQHLPLEDNE